MDIVARAKNICLTPGTEWPVIAGENTPAGTLITGYVLPLAAIGAVAGFIGGSIIGRSLPFVGYYRISIVSGLGLAVFTLVMAVALVFILSFIIDALAPTFGGQKDRAQALKLAAYCYTPAWVAGVLQILPMLGILGVLAGLYGIYLLYLGLPVLMKNPPDKSIPYTAVIVVIAIVVTFIMMAVGGLVVGAGALGGAMMSGGAPSASDVQFDPDSPLGRLQALGQQMEQSAAKMDEAEKSGDPAAQAAAAMEGLGTLLGGGRRVEPLALDQLKPFAPESLVGLAMVDSSSERSGIASLMVSRVEATYGDGSGRQIELEILDTGGVAGMMGLASWIGVQGEREDSSGSERTYRDGGRLIHEKASKSGGGNEFGVVLGERFVVSVKSSSVDFPGLKAAAATLDLARLESMKDAGVER